jgi:hypothetical protein
MTVAEKIPIAAGRSVWLETIETLFDEVETWASAHGWATQRRSKEFGDEFAPDKYIVPILEINPPSQRKMQPYADSLVLEPVMFNPQTGIQRIDFYVWPTMYRVRLIRRVDQDDWIIKTESSINWPLPWNEATFVQIAEEFLSA